MKTKFEIAIVGTGPAGLSAALNCKSRQKDFVLIGPKEGSKKISLAKKVDNYLGFDQISGKDLNDKFIATIKNNDFQYIDQTVASIYSLPNGFFLELKDGSMIEAMAVIVATGVNPSRKIKGEDNFLGSGISYCATCDAALYKDKDVAIIGYNEESLEEAEFLSGLCKSLTFVNLTGRKIEFSGTIEVVTGKPIEFIKVQEGLKLVLDNAQLLKDGYFVIRDDQGPIDLIPGIDLDKNHIRVEDDLSTNLPGLFACGDVVGLPYQILRAAGQGNLAGLSASKYIELKNKSL